jgi:hypothetical protein
MFKKISSFFSFLKNSDKIKETVSTLYISVCKVLNTLIYIESQINDTKLGIILKEYIPQTINILQKIKQIIVKYGFIVGFIPPVDAQNLIVTENLKTELYQISKKLDELI